MDTMGMSEKEMLISIAIIKPILSLITQGQIPHKLMPTGQIDMGCGHNTVQT